MKGREKNHAVQAVPFWLVFVTPKQPLAAGTTYTLKASGWRTSAGQQVEDASIIFTTSLDGNVAGGDPEVWIPDKGNGRGNWKTNRAPSKWEKQTPLQAQAGVTALAGTVLRLSGRPLANVTLMIGKQMARSDATGRFLLANVPAGHSELIIEGNTASSPGKIFGMFEYGVNLLAGQTNVLPFTIWLPVIDTKHAVSIHVPTKKEIVITHPDIPGLEVRIPAGTVIQTPDGQPLTTLSITPIPADRPPFPAPNGWHYTFVFQTHGSKVQSLHGQESQIQVTFPNSYVRTNRQVSLWAYDAAGRGWYTYDEADVSPDESKFISSGRHGLKRLACASLAGNSNLPVPAARDGAHDGDPVDLSTGLFIYRKTDLALPDTVPIALTRVYRQKDNAIRSFGVGATMNYDLFLAMDAAANWNSVILALPDGQQVVFNTLTNPPGPYGGAWQHVGEPAEFDQATLVYGGADATLADDRFWTMRLKDGSFLYFHNHGAMLSGITDRFGNSLTIDRFSRPGVTRITSPNGRWVDLTYAGAYVTQAKDSIGRTVSYTYDLNSRLSKVTDAAGGVTTYTYDTANDMLTITDPRNITYLTNQYNAQGLLSQQTQADNGVYQFAYTIDPSSNVIQTNVTDPLNIVRQVTFDSFGKMATDTHATGLPEQQVFTVNREPGTERLLSTVDALNRQTSYSYDGSGNLAGITELAGTPNAVTTTFAYEPVFNQLTSVTDALNHTTTFGYDSRPKGDSLNCAIFFLRVEWPADAETRSLDGQKGTA